MPSGFTLPGRLRLPAVPGLDAYLDPLTRFVNAPDWEESRLVVAAHPELLEPEADLVLAVLIDAAATQSEFDALRYLSLHRDALALCREVGAAEAFDRLRDEAEARSPAPPREIELAPDILETIAVNTLAVLTAVPARRAAWLESLGAIQAEAHAHRDGQMVLLLGSIRALLQGDEPGRLDPALEGEYRACWQQIVAGLTGPVVDGWDMRMFDAIARNALAALNAPPQAREEQRRHYETVRRMAEDLADPPLAALAGAVAGLLAGEQPGQPDAALTGAHRECWERIVAGLAAPEGEGRRLPA